MDSSERASPRCPLPGDDRWSRSGRDRDAIETRWGRDGVAMGTRWGRDGVAMGTRWGRDRDAMDMIETRSRRVCECVFARGSRTRPSVQRWYPLDARRRARRAVSRVSHTQRHARAPKRIHHLLRVISDEDKTTYIYQRISTCINVYLESTSRHCATGTSVVGRPNDSAIRPRASVSSPSDVLPRPCVWCFGSACVGRNLYGDAMGFDGEGMDGGMWEEPGLMMIRHVRTRPGRRGQAAWSMTNHMIGSSFT